MEVSRRESLNHRKVIRPHQTANQRVTLLMLVLRLRPMLKLSQMGKTLRQSQPLKMTHQMKDHNLVMKTQMNQMKVLKL